MSELRSLLDEIGPGKLPEERHADVVDLLKTVWETFSMPDAALDAFKLDRVENLEWDPPILSFRIERHGGAVLGSTRAELQCWWVNLDSGAASYDEKGYRQLKQQQKSWFANRAANEVADSIQNEKSDSRLHWISGEKVQVLTREIIPHSYRQTVEGRRRRFYKALDEALEGSNWTRSRSYCMKETKGN